MPRKKKEINYPTVQVRQDNNVTERRSSWDALMHRYYMMIVDRFEQRYEAAKAKVAGNMDEPLRMGDLTTYSIPLKEFDPSGTHLKDVKAVLKKLGNPDYGFQLGSDYDNDTSKDWVFFPAVAGAWYKAESKEFKIILSPLLVPLLIELKERYTYLNAWVAKQFEGKYTLRFYEWACQYRVKGEFFLDVPHIRWMLGLEEKHKTWSKLISKVIQPSCDELKRLYDSGDCDLYLDLFTKPEDKIQTGKAGRPTYNRIWFSIHLRKEVATEEQRAVPATDPKEVERFLDYITGVLKVIFSRSQQFRYPELVYMQLRALLQTDIRKGQEIIDKLADIRQNPNINDKAAYTRTVMANEFGINPSNHPVNHRRNILNAIGMSDNPIDTTNVRGGERSVGMLLKQMMFGIEESNQRKK